MDSCVEDDTDLRSTSMATQRLLSLEREKRIAAERLVEKERQALLQLRNLLSCKGIEINNKYQKEEDNPTTENSSKEPLQRSVSNTSAGFITRAFSQEFSSSVFNDLPGELQQSLALNHIDMKSGTPLSNALATINSNDSKRLLDILKDSESSGLIEKHGALLLCTAAEKGSTGCARVLLKLGCDPNVLYPGMSFPLHAVARNGQISTLQVLLDHDADINIVDTLGYCPLYLALQVGHEKIIEYLLAAGPSLDIMTKHGNSILHAAVLQDNASMLRSTLVQLRGSCDHETICHVINKRNEDGYTPLHQAAAEGYKSSVEVLCACPELNISLTDAQGRTAADMATPDCHIIIDNTASKEVTVVIETGETTQPYVAIGTVHVMEHHEWSDLQLMMSETLKHFCHIIQGQMGMRMMGNRSSPVYLPNMARGKIPEGLNQLLQMNTQDLFDEMEMIIKTRTNTLSTMDLNKYGFEQCLLGQYSISEEEEKEKRRKGTEGEYHETEDGSYLLQKTLSPFTVLDELEDMGECLEVKLKLCNGIDRLAFVSMCPAATLKEYNKLVMEKRLVMIHGPPETDLSLFLSQLTLCIKATSVDDMEEIHIPLHSDFTRADMICALHDNKLLHENATCDQSQTTEGSCVLILEGVDKLKTLDPLDDLSTLLQNQKKDPAVVWLDVTNHTHNLSYPAGKYKLRKQCYVIVSRTLFKSTESLPPSVMDQYAHIWLSDTAEPILGLLLRHYLCQIIDTRNGEFPSRFDSLYQVVVWVWQFWLLYNHYMCQLDFHHLKIGPNLFLNCPVQTGQADSVYNWFVEMWNYHLVPKIRDTLLNLDLPSKHHKISNNETLRLLMTFLTMRVMQLTCPLYPEGTHQLLNNLYGVGELQSFIFPNVKDKPKDHSRGVVQETIISKKSPKTRRGSNKQQTLTPEQSRKKDSGKTSRGPTSTDGSQTPPSNEKRSTPQKSRPKSTGFFGRTGTLRRSLFKSSQTSLYSVQEEEAGSGKSKRKKEEQEPNTDQIENLFDLLMDMGSSKMDKQRVNIPDTPPSHHTIPVSPTESSNDSLETTTVKKDHSQSVQVWKSQELLESPGSTHRNHVIHPRIATLQFPSRERSRSEDNVFQQLEEKDMSIDDLIRPSSATTLTIHKHERSISSDVLSDSSSSLSNTSADVLVSSQSVDQLNEEDKRDSGYEKYVEDKKEGMEKMPRWKRNSTSILYSASLGLSLNSPIRRTSVSIGDRSLVRNRKSIVPALMIWEDEGTVEM